MLSSSTPFYITPIFKERKFLMISGNGVCKIPAFDRMRLHFLAYVPTMHLQWNSAGWIILVEPAKRNMPQDEPRFIDVCFSFNPHSPKHIPADAWLPTNNWKLSRCFSNGDASKKRSVCEQLVPANWNLVHISELHILSSLIYKIVFHTKCGRN